jgi:hypothetical protein
MGMAAQCTVCANPRIEEIHHALDAGRSVKDTAKGFDIARTTLTRHVAHRSTRTRTAKAPSDFEAAGPKPPRPRRPPTVTQARAEVASAVRALAEQAQALAKDAEASDATLRDRATCLTAARGVLELLGKLTRELGPDPEVKILGTPQWEAVTAATMGALEAYPDALAAVVEAWESLARGE